jgi:integrase
MEILTGARLGEIARIRWEHIDWENRVLQIHGTKTEYVSSSLVRYLELTPTMENILRERQKLNRFGEYVFCRTGNTITHYHQIMKQAAKTVGIPYGAGKRGGFVGHDARHTAITRMLQAGIDLATVGSITGHSDKTLILHYSHATRESKRIASKVLDDFGTVDVENNGLKFEKIEGKDETVRKKRKKNSNKKGE